MKLRSFASWCLLCSGAAVALFAACNAGYGSPGIGGTPGRGYAPAEAAQLPSFRPGSDELWIVAESPREQAPASPKDGPGSGTLLTRDEQGAVVPVPLRHTQVRANVRSFLCTVDVEQQFHNPYPVKIEALYVFPLPDDAAVRDFVLTIGERQIRGIVRAKEEAQRIYREARAQGYRAALLDQARPNVFEEKVANIEPGHAIDVRIRYFHTLAYGPDGYEFVFPMVVGPRYNPPGFSAGVGAVPAGQQASQPGSSGQPTEVAYATADTRIGTDIGVEVDVDAGMPLTHVRSPSHAIAVERPSGSRAVVRLAGGTTIPNRDFVLRLGTADRECRAAMLTHADDRGGHLAMLVQPPAGLGALPRQPLELIFVLDCSGSMDGVPLSQAKAAAELALDRLGPADSFQIIRFSDQASSFAPAPVPATAENILRGRRHLRDLAIGGGTQMLRGIQAALAVPHDPEQLRFLVFLTDGYIGNERQVFDATRNGIGSARVFSLGIGSSVNRYLLEGLARIGRGAVGYLLHDEPPGQVVAQLYDRISHPAMTDLAIDWGGANVTDVFPARMPDLFVGRPLAITARFLGTAPASVRVRGRVGGVIQEFTVPVVASTPDDAATALPALWARRKIQSLSDFAEVEGREAAPDQVRELALAHGLASDFTSFVAVDASGRTAGDHGVSLQVPVPMPVGVRYETTVSEK